MRIPNSVVADSQVYEAISALFPELSMERCPENIFQFSAMPMTAGWTYEDDAEAQQWCEFVSPRRDGYYMVGSARFSQGYRTILVSADQTALGELTQAYQAARQELDLGPCRAWIDGSPVQDAMRWSDQDTFDFVCYADSDRGADNAFIKLFDQAPEQENLLDILLPRCSFELRVKGAAVYPVRRDAWYRPELVTPSFPLVEGGVVARGDFFGPGGALQHTPELLLVSYAAKMLLHVDQKSLPRLLGRNSENETVRLGGLEFSLSDWIVLPLANGLGDDGALTVEFPSVTDLPQIWGVVSRKAYL